MKRERDKLEKTLGGIREMGRTPAAVWVVDTKKEHLAVEEARKLRIPIIGILDTNCDPDEVDYPIPGNDDAIRAVGLLTRVVADAVAEGLIARSGATKSEGTTSDDVATDEPLAEWERELLQGDADKAAVEATGGDAATETTPAAEATGAATEAPAADAAAEAATEAPAAEAPAAEATPAAPATEAPAASDEGEFGPGSAAPLESGGAPAGFEIKGNKSSKKFHAPSSPWYDRTNAEVWFRTAEDAEAAGFVNAETKADEKA